MELSISDPPSSWSALGFATEGGAVALGRLRLRLGADGDGIGSWTLSGIEPTATIDGLPTSVVERAGDAGSAVEHPNTVVEHPNTAVGLDHVVVVTPDFDRTEASLAEAGMPFRRVRTAWQGERSFRQGFRRLGPAILEVVELKGPPVEDPARFWGLVVIVADIDALADRLGPEIVSAPKEAVQPGRRIATLQRAAGLSPALAFMTPEPSRER